MRSRRFFVLTLLLPALAAAADVPQRIVSLSPDLTEILYGVGAFNRVVGVSDYDTYPPGVAKLPRVGQLHSPSLEKLTALRPDLVIINNAQAPFLEDTLKELGLRVLKTSSRSLEEVYAAVIAIGRATGNKSEAGKLAAATHEVRFPNGEAFADMRVRVLKAVGAIRRERAGQTVMVVSHGGVNRILIAQALQMPDHCLFRLAQDHAAMNLLSFLDGSALVQLVNHCPALLTRSKPADKDEDSC